MIVPRALTEAEQKTAQRVYYAFTGTNAFIAGCSGMTPQVLLAMYLGIGSAWISGIGALGYLNFLFLPMGVLLAGKFGVGRTIRLGAWLYGAMCLLPAVSSLLPGGRGVVFAVGVQMMNLSLACVTAMLFPLQKNITTPVTIFRFLSGTQIISASVTLLTGLGAAGFLAVCADAAALPLLFCAAAAVSIYEGWFIERLPEPAILRELASHPVLPQIRDAWRSGILRRQLLTGVMQNLALVTLVSVNILTAGKGCGMNGQQTMILSMIQMGTVILFSRGFKAVSERFGPRRVMIASYPLVWALALYWILIPPDGGFVLMIPPFLVAGILQLCFSVSQNAYFTITVPNSIQIGGTILLFLIAGGLVGAAGLVLNPLIFKLAECYPAGDAMTPFRMYYLIAGILSVPGIRAAIRLPNRGGRRA